jgi:hypothetical protein
MRIVELESGAFQSFDVIDFGAVQIKHAGLVDEDPEVAKVVRLVKHVGLVLEVHGIAEPGAAAADDGNAQARRFGILHTKNLVHFADCRFGELNHRKNLLQNWAVVLVYNQIDYFDARKRAYGSVLRYDRVSWQITAQVFETSLICDTSFEVYERA